MDLLKSDGIIISLPLTRPTWTSKPAANAADSATSNAPLYVLPQSCPWKDSAYLAIRHSHAKSASSRNNYNTQSYGPLVVLSQQQTRFFRRRRSQPTFREPKRVSSIRVYLEGKVDKIDVEEKDLNRHSNFKATHECTCSEEGCMTVHCICFLTPREICVIGQCCTACISAKNEYLQTIRGFELERDRRERKQVEQ